MEQYTHLGDFSDWLAEAGRQSLPVSGLPPGEETRTVIRELLGFSRGSEDPLDVRVERCWVKDGVAGEEVSWGVGFGPRTVAWVLKPEGAQGPLPAVLGLHDHGGFKFCGKEKIADGPTDPEAYIRDWWAVYGGRAWANALARQGYLVVVHDTFLWGSRRFDYDTMTRAVGAVNGVEGRDAEVARYNVAAGLHEHLVEKYCNLLGTTLAGVVSREDRIALNYLLSRSDADQERVACMGLSGGGNRSALLMATAQKLKAAVIVGLMSTYAGLLDHNVVSHTWMFFPAQLARRGDWPDLAASRAPAQLLVQYDLDDDLFTPAGMQAAHGRLQAVYAQIGTPENYTGQFFPGPHQFSLEMQEKAFAWLGEVLRPAAGV